ncbi:iron-containing alcohol dehydrogenase family protein [Cytobacillus purgationiresistens]|uniref:Glycerol dehydrogenase n=1 Tax=Cytobacillus purgationiresistens TaxID=863449 RepID=A0ABU0AQ74_9BACI|nr:iron-containing alcohol dehydrogenase family protein [Cytobacillus purgationiresistens]MDQ0273436.1 glycerol dehydrogenase [Cytobacillus purgationiresistens]
MKVTVGPAQYIRESGLLSEIGLYIEKFGKKAVLIGGIISRETVEAPLIESLTKHGMTLEQSLWYGGEASITNVDLLVEKLDTLDYDVIIAAGGGKAIDTVKAVAHRVNKPLVAIPTIAATCAATTPICIIYSDEGEFLEISRESKVPEMVLVDSDVILHAPVRYLIAGIGDTLAKWFETKTSAKKAIPNARNQTAIAIAGQLYQTMLNIGKQAVTSIEEEKMTPELEDMIDAVILISGSVSGYGGDDCRTAGAHAIYSGLTIFPEVHETYHGEIVAFGILAMLCMEGEDEQEIRELIRYYQEVSLPYTLKQMNIARLTEAQWQELGEVSVTIEDMANMPFDVTPEMVVKAVSKADSIGNEMLVK